jgi:hypothetical protein
MGLPVWCYRLRMVSKCLLLIIVWGTGFAVMSVEGCKTTGECSNGTCECSAGDSCDFTCGAPPCHALCAGDNHTCKAVCANGTCTCGRGSDCNFTCMTPPCHVSCEENTTCMGTCSNGQCTCGANSECTFACATSPCHSTCAAGSTCVVFCPAGSAGTQGCDIVSCAAGAPVICPGGNATTCGAPCPTNQS